MPCYAGPSLSQQRSWTLCLQCGSMRTFKGPTVLRSPWACCKMWFLMPAALVLHRFATAGWQLAALPCMRCPKKHDCLSPGRVRAQLADPCSCSASIKSGQTTLAQVCGLPSLPMKPAFEPYAAAAYRGSCPDSQECSVLLLSGPPSYCNNDTE